MKQITIYILATCILLYLGYMIGNNQTKSIQTKLETIQSNTKQVRAIVERNNKLMEEVITEVNSIPEELLKNLNIKTIK